MLGRLVILVGGLPLVFHPEEPEAGWQVAASLEASAALSLGTNAQACVEWKGHLVISSGRGGSTASCAVAALTFDAHLEYAECADEACENTHARPWWAHGRWKALGDAGDSARVGAALTVVHDKLYLSGGVHGHCFEGSILRWAGTIADPRSCHQSESTQHGRETVIEHCRHPWVAVTGLELPTAMHAHAAISIPWLPSMIA